MSKDARKKRDRNEGAKQRAVLIEQAIATALDGLMEVTEDLSVQLESIGGAELKPMEVLEIKPQEEETTMQNGQKTTKDLILDVLEAYGAQTLTQLVNAVSEVSERTRTAVQKSLKRLIAAKEVVQSEDLYSSKKMLDARNAGSTREVRGDSDKQPPMGTPGHDHREQPHEHQHEETGMESDHLHHNHPNS